MARLKSLFNELMSSFMEKKYREHVDTFDRGNVLRIRIRSESE